jgi:hypothetical protein
MAKWSDVLGVITKVAPSIGSIAGGPVGGIAVSALESALGIGKSSDDLSKRQDSIAAAISGATPEQLLALKQADNDFQAKMTALGFENAKDLESLAVQDRDSARKREASVKDWTPRVLAYAVVFASLGIGYGVLYHKLSADSATVGMIAGFIFREAASVLSYYFGSSSDSAKQTEALVQGAAK